MSLLKKLFGPASKDKAQDIDIDTVDDYKRNALFAAIIDANEAAAIYLINRGIAGRQCRWAAIGSTCAGKREGQETRAHCCAGAGKSCSGCN